MHRRRVRIRRWLVIGTMLALAQPASAALLPGGSGDPAGARLRAPDWFVIAGYGLGMLAVGVYFSRRAATSDEYLLGGRNMRPTSVGLSLFASLISTISYLSMPGEMIMHGPVYLWYIAAIPIVYLAVGYALIPYFMRLPVTSAYEILERRLGLNVRLLGSLIFLFIRLVWMSLVVYVSSEKVIVVVMGWTPDKTPYVCLVIGVLTILYTTMGGLRAVILTDVIQSFILFLGAVLTILVITIKLGGFGWWPTHWMPNWDTQPVFSLDPHVRLTVAGTLVCTFLWWVCTAGSDQMAIQRYLATRDAKAARRAFLTTNAADSLVTVLLAAVGFALVGFFQHNPQLFGGDLKSHADALFPTFIARCLPVGVTGLILSALLAAAMSGLSAGINSTSTVIAEDLVRRFRRVPLSERGRVRLARCLSLLVGAFVVALGSQMGRVPGNILEATNKTSNLFTAPLFGLFFMALFVPFATSWGTILGTVCGLASAVLVAYWEKITGLPAISFQWILPVSLLVNIVAGCLFSLLIRGPLPPQNVHAAPAPGGFPLAG